MADDARVTILGVADDGSAALYYYGATRTGSDVSLTPQGSDEHPTTESARAVIDRARDAVSDYTAGPDLSQLAATDADRYRQTEAKLLAAAKKDTPIPGGLNALLMVAPFLESETQGAAVLEPDDASGLFVDERISGFGVDAASLPSLPSGTAPTLILIST